MKTYELLVYQFDELSNEAKEKAISQWYESEDYPFLSENLTEIITECYDTEKVFSDIKLCYSLSYCQGDGLSFSASFDFEKWLQRYTFQDFKKRALIDIYTVEIKQNTGHYCYAHEGCVNGEACYMNTIELRNLDQLFETVLDDIKAYYLEVCKQTEKAGYSELEYRMSFEEFSDLCECNGYNFDENGKMINA